VVCPAANIFDWVLNFDEKCAKHYCSESVVESIILKSAIVENELKKVIQSKT
jgi:hypothetical protein